MKRAKKIFKITVISIFTFLIIAVVTAELTSRPSFCSTCHYMEPFYESWKASVHKNVQCTKCHFPPGLTGTIKGKMMGLVQVVNYLSNSYTRRRPWAEISDASCLQSGCHVKQKLNKDVLYKGLVHFNHKAHLTQNRRGKKLRCTSCHSQIVQGEHIVVTETTCFLCHFKNSPAIPPAEYKKVSDCKTCHQWNKFTPGQMAAMGYNHTEVVKKGMNCLSCHSDVIVGDGYVPKENCYSCHFDNYRLSKYDDTKLIHTMHVTKHKVECTRCHLQIQHKVQKINASSNINCTSCHSNVHEEQLILFAGKKVDGIKAEPNPMYLKGLHCSSCHIFHKKLFKNSNVRYANKKSCEKCHGKGYAKLLNIWNDISKQGLKKLRNDIVQASNVIKNSRYVHNTNIQQNIKEATKIAEIIETGKAVHNIKYSDDLISAADSLLNDAMKLAKSKVRFVKTRNIVPNECSNCHAGIENVTVDYKGYKYPHKTHVLKNKMSCFECHSNQNKHGELIYSKNKCDNCHHSESNQEKCSACHNGETAIYNGKAFGANSPGPMKQADVGCTDCHVEEGKVIRPKINVCENCHEKEYTQTAKDWQDEYLSDFNDLVNKLKKLKHLKRNKTLLRLSKDVKFLQYHSGKGIHNHELLMDRLEQLTSKADKLLKKK